MSFPVSFTTYAFLPFTFPLFLMWGICAKPVLLLFVHSWTKCVFVALPRIADMICHFIKRFVYQLVLSKQLKEGCWAGCSVYENIILLDKNFVQY